MTPCTVTECPPRLACINKATDETESAQPTFKSQLFDLRTGLEVSTGYDAVSALDSKGLTQATTALVKRDHRELSLKNRVLVDSKKFSDRHLYVSSVRQHCAEAKKMLKLEADWDGDGAPAIPKAALAFASQFAIATADECYDTHGTKAVTLQLSPGGEASVILYAKTGHGSFYGECFLDDDGKPYIQISAKIKGETQPTHHRLESSSIVALAKISAPALVQLSENKQ